ncbi:uncharacterized protein LOC107626541 [Arachis ipaensis]|uniref:uncharacterized protein LOC107626541 n=1 Tax=Arachis ipaensis TaxID=130454 RepID=UPI0007AF3AA7|nr:uncharacterized protein LOC107626541 [Arachis ipaensis]XP_025635216.1 uncharacterized protein LOC112729055 [Arachis hypogaea]
MITMILVNAHLHISLVDQGSSADILFKPAFDKLGLDEKELRAYPDTLYGLGDTPIKPLGFLSLHTIFGRGEKSKTLSVDFIVIDVESAYNALIGRATLNRLGAVVSTPHLCMKFAIYAGIATIRGDQKLARKCYNESLNLREKGREVHTIELGGVRAKEELRPQPGEKTEEIQRRRKLGLERAQAVEEQVQALLEAGFIREVKYPTWLANMVVVKKQNGKWRMCVDYTDLNKACPKDPYPLPSIDILVDSSSGGHILKADEQGICSTPRESNGSLRGRYAGKN